MQTITYATRGEVAHGRMHVKTIKGPALFLAQFAGDDAPFDSWGGITRWAADCGYAGVQVPSWDKRLIDLDQAAESRAYCEEWLGQAEENGITVTELACHLQGQLGAWRSGGAAGLGGGAGEEGHPCLLQPWAHGASDFFGRAGLALYLPLAAAPGRAGRDGL